MEKKKFALMAGLVLIMLLPLTCRAEDTPDVPTNRVAVGYNLELNSYYGPETNIGNGFVIEYTHSFRLGRSGKLFMDFGPRLIYSRIGNVDYMAHSSGYAVEADHYTNYSLRLPACVSFRIPHRRVTFMPNVGLQLGVILHHEPNDHDGKVYIALPAGAQAGLGIGYSKWYFGVECASTWWSTYYVDLSLSVGFTF